ncbi:TonB-dependent receptor [Caulobacter sp. 17J65-9]|uniref:TonB-dependent receptor n=1 Tax=Caulobacter sp. 17J65-9 TaxID=2709382 RepID=UPI0013C628C4|nr:TonB-dependent receptor [Caulobacter sp. 17J65-9]NEX93238.1 TonB-dependent receptor [Caulobacter sp. 17J65-9]
MTSRLALALLASVSLTPICAHAQDATAVDEVVVTAQKREELLREVPQSVTAITDETLERIQANDFSDYVGRVPGLTVVGDQPGNQRLTLRGLNTSGISSTVGTYMDETPFGSSTSLVNSGVLALDLDPSDVKRVEVLRGPQGTLYGAGSLGGLIKYVTVQPSTAGFEARVRGSAEQTDDGEGSWGLRGAVNLPMGERAALRVSGMKRSQGGYIDDPARGESDINGLETSALRAAFLFNATDKLTFRASAYVQKIESDAQTGVAYFQSPLEPVAGDLDQFRLFSEKSDITYRIYNATVDYDLGWAALVSSTSWGELEQYRESDGSMAFGLPSFLANDLSQEKFTQELRLVSPEGERLDWVAGLFYTKEEGLIDQEIFFGPPPGSVTGLTARIASDYEEVAAFGEVKVKFSPQFDVSVGARYAKNDQTVDQSGTAVGAGGEVSSENATTFSIAPRYRMNDHTMFYGRIATGYRPGGPNIVGVASVIPPTFGSDTTTNYELGVKTDLVPGVLRLDASVFHVDWQDIQLAVFDGTVTGNANGGSAETQGVEWTATLTPHQGLTFVWAGAVTDTELTSDTDPIVVGGVSGDPLPYSPDWSSTLDGEYEWALANGAQAYVGATWRVVGEQSTAFPGVGGFLYGAQQIEVPSYTTIDLRGGVEFGRYAVELYAKNVGDERGPIAFGNFGQTLPDAPNGEASVLRPRTIGLSLSARY